MSDLIMISESKEDVLKNPRDEILTIPGNAVKESVVMSPSEIKIEEGITTAGTKSKEQSEAPMINPSEVLTVEENRSDLEPVESSNIETDGKVISDVEKTDDYTNKSILEIEREQMLKMWKETPLRSKKYDKQYREKLLPNILKKAYVRQFEKSLPEKWKNDNLKVPSSINATADGKSKFETIKNNISHGRKQNFKRPAVPIESVSSSRSQESGLKGMEVGPISNPTTSSTAMETDDLPDIVGFLRKWTKDHKIPLPALNCLLKCLRLFPSLDFIPEDAKKLLGQLELNDSPQAKLLNLIETKFDRVFSRLASVENNHKLLTNTMNVLMESVVSTSAPPRKKPKLQTEFGRTAQMTEEDTSSEITLPLHTLVEMRKFNQMLSNKNFRTDMIEKMYTPDIMNLCCVEGIVARLLSKLLTAAMIRQHNVSGLEVFKSASGSSKTNFSSYMNIVTLIVTVVSLQVETACPSTVYMAISAFLKRSAENRKYTEEN